MTATAPNPCGAVGTKRGHRHTCDLPAGHPGGEHQEHFRATGGLIYAIHFEKEKPAR